MTGEELEDAVEELLIEFNMNYKREGKQMAYGHKAGKGKCDFILENHAIECKSTIDLNKLSIPAINKKTGKPYSSPSIKTHQLAFLRRFKGTGWLLIHESKTNTSYALTMNNFDTFVIANNLPRSLKGIDEYKINLDEFIGGLKK